MPQKPKHECATPGCPNLTGTRLCADCAIAESKRLASERDPQRKRLYNSAYWKRLRLAILRRNPICESCGTVAATDVDHIIPRSAGGTNRPDNLQSLCKACHSRKTASEGRWGGAGKILNSDTVKVGPLAMQI